MAQPAWRFAARRRACRSAAAALFMQRMTSAGNSVVARIIA
jgi:hypothetical protein